MSKTISIVHSFSFEMVLLLPPALRLVRHHLRLYRWHDDGTR